MFSVIFQVEILGICSWMPTAKRQQQHSKTQRGPNLDGAFHGME